MFWSWKSILPDRESNPGLPRDRRRSSPLDYRGIDVRVELSKQADDCRAFCFPKMKKNLPRAGFEPATYGCLSIPTTVHRSTNWAITSWPLTIYCTPGSSHLSRTWPYAELSGGLHCKLLRVRCENQLVSIGNITYISTPTLMLMLPPSNNHSVDTITEQQDHQMGDNRLWTMNFVTWHNHLTTVCTWETCLCSVLCVAWHICLKTACARYGTWTHDPQITLR